MPKGHEVEMVKFVLGYIAKHGDVQEHKQAHAYLDEIQELEKERSLSGEYPEDSGKYVTEYGRGVLPGETPEQYSKRVGSLPLSGETAGVTGEV